MYSKALVLLPFAIGLVSTQSLSADDFPQECSDSCGPIAAASDSCDQQFDNDNEELDCICTTQGVRQQVPACMACVEPYSNSDGDFDDAYGDVSEILRACGFASNSTANNGSSSAPPASTTVYSTTLTTTNDDGETETETEAVTAIVQGGNTITGSQTVITTTSDGSATAITSTISPTPTGAQGSSASSSANAAAAAGAPLAAAGILAALAAL